MGTVEVTSTLQVLESHHEAGCLRFWKRIYRIFFLQYSLIDEFKIHGDITEATGTPLSVQI